MTRLPRWADLLLVPLVSLALAAGISILVILSIGEDPVEAMQLMLEGTVFSAEGWGKMLFSATSFMFTGLAVTVAFHAAQFNIGAEGQAQLGGLGVAIACLFIPWPHWSLALVAATLAAAFFGAAWASIPAWLAAKRGSHIVITTIMFNAIATALLIYLLGGLLKPAGSAHSASAMFPPTAHLPRLAELPILSGVFRPTNPVNISLVIAIACCFLVWALLWRTRLGYEMRAFGKSEPAAVYAGISPVKMIIVAMLISGALAGLMAVNVVMGGSGRLAPDSAAGAGFIGIAVALMGRNHPFGVFLAALLFGFLYQGGAELDFWTDIPIELRTMMQALVILFTGALDNMVRMMLNPFFRYAPRQGAE